MKRIVAFVLVVLCTLSITEAKKKKAYYFNLYEELQGSWILMKSTLSMTSGELIGLSEQLMFNVTKSDIPNELVVAEVALENREEKRKPYQIIISASDNFTAVVNRFEPGAEVEVSQLLSVHFHTLLKDEVYYTSGSLEQTANARYELSLLPGKTLKFEIDLEDSGERVVYMGKKVIIPKQKTFFQKYGTYFVIALAFIVQMITTRMNQNTYGM